MRQAPEPANPSGSPKSANALAVFAIVLLLGMIAAAGVRYFFGTGFYATLAASFAFGVYLPFVPGKDVATKIAAVIGSFIVATITMLFFGLIVAAALQYLFGAGFYATLIVSLFLAVPFALLIPFSPEVSESGSPSSGVSANAKRSVSDALRGRLAEVGAMSGTEFEEFMADVFRAMGYGVTHMGSSGDQGVDLLLLADDATIIAVQCKNYAKPVGNRPVQEVYAGARYQDASRAWVVAPRGYTKGAFELAGRLDVLLIDGSGIRKFIDQPDANPRYRQGKKSRESHAGLLYARLLQNYRGYLDALEKLHEVRAQGTGGPEAEREFEAGKDEAYAGIESTLSDLDVLEEVNVELPIEERAALQTRQAQIEREEKLREGQRRASEQKLKEEREEQRRQETVRREAAERAKREQEAKRRKAEKERAKREQEKQRRKQAGQDEGRGGRGSNDRRRGSGNPDRRGTTPAHEILGVAPDAPEGEIVAAYRKMARLYHPDRVSGLGPEFGELAERRMKEINAAYAELRAKKR